MTSDWNLSLVLAIGELLADGGLSLISHLGKQKPEEADARLRRVSASPRRRSPAGLRNPVCNLEMLLFCALCVGHSACTRLGWYHYVMLIVSEISLYMRRTSAADGGTRYIPEEEKRPHTALGGMRVLWYTERRYLGSDSREGLSITSLCILSIIQIKVV